ncbi:MAG: 1,4-alpha-glucan branching enzyme, partial [Acidobacteria bacterium]
MVTVLEDDLQRLAGGRHHDPFAVLGKHAVGERVAVVRAHIPAAIEVMIAEGEVPLERIGNSDLFEWRGEPSSVPERYRLIWRDVDHREHIAHDPYVYPPLLSQADLELFARGAHHAPYEFLGAREREIDGVAGVLFAVWAPNAERVSVV